VPGDAEFHPPTLSEALEAQDAAAVAFALRNGTVTVPLLPSDGDPHVRVFRRGDADRYMLLLFSSPATYATMVPEEDDRQSAQYDSAQLLDFLAQNVGVLESVWFDVAGPHAMQAEPRDVLDALKLEAPER
jgi:hypothetical protein